MENLQNGGKNFSVVCPMCRQFKGSSYTKQKLVIKTVHPHFVHCWVCGYKARNIYKLIAKYHPANLKEYKESFVNAEELEAQDSDEGPEETVVELPAGFKLLAELVRDFDSIHSPVTRRYVQQALEYLKSRNINTRTELWYWKLGITEDREARCKYRIIIPSYDSSGELSYWTARSWTRKPMFNYKNPPSDRRKIIFNELNIDWEEPLTIVEGPFDLLKANQNATAVLGSEELTLEFALLQKIVINKTPVVLAFDPEPKAQKKQFRLAKRLAEFDISVRILEYPSWDKDIGDMTRNEFMKLLNSAKPLTENYELRMRITSLLN